MASISDITGSLTGIIQGLGAAVRNMGLAMTAASAVAGGAMFTLARRADRVSEAFREVDTIASRTSDTQAKYGELVSELNTEMGINANKIQVIDGLYKSLSAGITDSTEAQNAFLKSAARLSVVGRTDLKTTVDVLSTSINAYGEENMNAERSSNALFATVQFGKTTLEELAPVMGRVIALGSDMDVTIEELGASMAVLTRTGFESRIAATGLRAILRGLMKPTKDMQSLLRDLALEQDLFADSMGESSEQVRQLAEDYRSTTDALSDFEEQQKSARNSVEENSLKIQEARLLQQAIERGQREEAEKVIETEELRGATYEELEEKIASYRFEVNQSRVEEERARQKKQELQEKVSELESTFKEEIDTAGDLGSGVGQLVVENEGLIETLTKLRERANEQGIAMDDLFNRSRGLQAALALLGDNGELVNEIYAAMQQESGLTEEKMAELEERFGTTKDEILELRQGVTEVTDEFEKTKGPVQEQRDAFAVLGEAATDLGEVFNEMVNERVVAFAEFVGNAVDKISNLEESVKDQIGTFLVLATSIGLVLGPLLFLGGQIAIIASVMGSMFLPFTLAAGSAIGILARGLLIASEGGEEATSMFKSMRGVLSGLIDFLSFLRTVFVQEVLPGMRIAGQGIIDVISAVIGEVNKEVGDGANLIRQFASLWGSAFAIIGTFLSNNANAIASYVGLVVGILINQIIPAVVKIGRIFISDVFPKIISFIKSQVIPTAIKLGDVFINKALPALIAFGQSAWKSVKPALLSLGMGLLSVVDSLFKLAQTKGARKAAVNISNAIRKMALSFVDLIDSLGKFLQQNSDLVARLIVAGTALYGFARAFSFLKPIISALAPVILRLGGAIGTAIGFIRPLVAAVRGAPLAMLTFRGAIRSVGATLLGLSGPIGWAIAIIATLASLWIADVGGMRAKMKPLVDLVSRFANGLRNKVLPAVINFSESVWRLVTAIGGLIKTIIDVVFKILKLGDGSHLLTAIFTGLRYAVDGVINVLTGLFQAMAGVIDIFSAVILLLQGDFDAALVALIQGLINVDKGIKNILFGLGQFMFGIFAFIIGGIWGLAVDLAEAIVAPFIWGYNKVKDGLASFGTDVVDAFKKIPGQIYRGLTGAGKMAMVDVVGVFSGLKEDVIGKNSPLKNLVEEALNVGENIVKNIIQGLENLKQDLKEKAQELANVISNQLPESPAKEGPFSKPHGPQSRGEAISEGLAKGMKNKKGEVRDSTQEVVDQDFDSSEIDVDNVEYNEPDGEEIDTETEDVSIDTRTDVWGDDGVPEKGEFEENTNVKEKDMKNQDVDGMGQTINIKEKAVFFEKGAFQGVSDDEIPEMVKETVDKSMDEIIEDLEAKGLSSE